MGKPLLFAERWDWERQHGTAPWASAFRGLFLPGLLPLTDQAQACPQPKEIPQEEVWLPGGAVAGLPQPGPLPASEWHLADFDINNIYKRNKVSALAVANEHCVHIIMITLEPGST
ncbi:hypothetical protein WJX72_010829 [[Myrmecia] bisecta]|uniref:Uncharacterized protein n=1 Tax=[Myrmecia] bisecta TaxID=41462 RepID=A0AAW1RAH7_9CHLO